MERKQGDFNIINKCQESEPKREKTKLEVKEFYWCRKKKQNEKKQKNTGRSAFDEANDRVDKNQKKKKRKKEKKKIY